MVKEDMIKKGVVSNKDKEKNLEETLNKIKEDTDKQKALVREMNEF